MTATINTPLVGTCRTCERPLLFIVGSPRVSLSLRQCCGIRYGLSALVDRGEVLAFDVLEVTR